MFTDHELYGPKLAYQDSATDDKNSRNLPIQSIFQIIVQAFERKKLDMGAKEIRRTLQIIQVDQAQLSTELTDCLTKYLKETNIRERDYLRE